MVCMIARQGIPDMPLCARVMGAIAMFTLAVEDGARPISRVFAGRTLTHGHLVLAVTGAMVGVQALYYVAYFVRSPQIAIPHFVQPVACFPIFMGLLFAAMWRNGWMVLRFAAVIVGSLIAVGVALVPRQ